MTPAGLLTALALFVAPAESDEVVHPLAVPSTPEPGALVETEPPPLVRFETYENDPIGVKRFELDNGLTVLLSENHEQPVVFGSIVVDAGGKDDPADATGMAHYLEHMLFKGTGELGTVDYEKEAELLAELSALYDQLAAATEPAERERLSSRIKSTAAAASEYAIPLEYEKLIGEIGGTESNAYTTPDMTVYHNVFPASEMQAWLRIQAHRFDQPVFRLFPSEIEAVYEEKNMSMDSFLDPVAERFLEGVFPGHPYGTQTVLGSVEHLKRPSLSKMRAYFDTWYVANNMALILVGDFDSEQVAPWIVEQFSGWRSAELPERPGYRPDAFDGRESMTVRMTPVRAGAVALRTVPPTRDDAVALMLAEGLLSNEQGSGLIDALADDGKLLMASTMPLELDEAGMTIVFFVPKILGQSMRKAERLVLEQLERVAEGRFEDADLRALRESMIRDQQLAFEDNEARGDMLAAAFVRGQRWDEVLAQHHALRSTTRVEVQSVASRYWGSDYFVMRSRTGFPRPTRLEKPDLEPVKPRDGAHSSFHRRAQEFPRGESRAQFVDFTAAIDRREPRHGLKLEHNVNPINDIYSLELRFGVGRHEIPALWVLGDYIERAGAGDLTGQQLKKRFEAIATQHSFRATEYEFIISLKGPDEHLEAALALVESIWSRPRRDATALRRLVRERKGEWRIAARDPAYLSDALQAYAMYGDESVYLRDPGPKTLRRMGVDALLDGWSRTHGHAVRAGYVGRRDADEVEAVLVRGLPLVEAPEPAVDPFVIPRVSIDEPTTYVLPTRRAVQTHLGYWIEGEPLTPREDPLARAFNEYVAGESSGLIFEEVRERRALAYTAYGYYSVPSLAGRPGGMFGYVACQADKTDEAAVLMQSLLSEMPSREQTMDGMRAALEHEIETGQPGFRELRETIRRWELQGFVEDPRRGRQRVYPELSFSEVMGFYERQVAGRPILQTVVGNPRRFDLEHVAGEGKTVRVRRAQILSP